MSDGSFAAVAADARLCRAGLILLFVLIAVGTVATVIYSAVLIGFDRMDRTETVLRQVLIGTPTGVAVWLLWRS